ncbi:MAG: hypothetical protein CO032_02790 [Nitrosopumilales archaeon CG_4_9_14_0_2_um_filter_34_16]|nr:MAG: hypothetical protein CO032_02790 [Nitrosopumilales archaeon CG_4_9_14_0_2_um_filter_34_16]
MRKIPILVGIALLTGGIIAGLSINVSADESLIPSWIKNTAGFWVDGQIGDSEFISALQFLVKEGILVIPTEGNSQDEIQSDDFVNEEIKSLFPFRHELGLEWVIELNTDWENNIENTIGNQVYYYNPTVAGFNTPEVWVTIWKFDNLDAPADELDYVYSEKVVKTGGFTELSVPKSPFEFDKECYAVQRILDGGREMVVIECYLKDSPFYASVAVTGDPWDFKTERDLDWFPTANKFMTSSLDKIRDLKH